MAALLKLSKRLKHIVQMVTSEYTHIWDCCCDHGFLGASLLSRQVAGTIHFVDIVPELITKVEVSLQQFYSDSRSTWKTHCLDVAELPLEIYEGKQLIIIAGIGGDLMSRIINDIHQRHPNLNADFLLCPVHRQFALRKKLIELDFSLKDEILIEDKKRLYEVMHISSKNDENLTINPVGDKIWRSETAKQAAVVETYLNKTLNYYSKIQQGDNTTKVDQIISAYNAVNI